MYSKIFNLFNLAKEEKQNTVLIEQTGKRWKLLQIVTFVFGLGGITLICFEIWFSVYQPILDLGFNNAVSPLEGFNKVYTGLAGFLGVLLFIVALFTGSYAKFMAWWNHG